MWVFARSKIVKVLADNVYRIINTYSIPCTYIHCVADTEETMGITGLLIYFGICD